MTDMPGWVKSIERRLSELDRRVRSSGSSGITGSTTTTAPAAGAASALPATPAGYVTIRINNADRQIPYY